MKYTILSLIFCLYSYNLISQNYGNDWINPNQTYIKIETTERGIYRIDMEEFQAVGIDISSIPVDNFHLYFRGEEQKIFLYQNSNGEVQGVEFFADRLDGKDDAGLYRDASQGRKDPGLQPHPEFSLFSDSSVFYLTWDQQASSSRYQTYFNDAYGAFIAEPHFRYESLILFDPAKSETNLVLGGGGPYEPFYTLNPLYGIGEGYLGPAYGTGTPLSLNFDTPSARSDTPAVAVDFRIFGRSRTRHHVNAAINGDTANPFLDTTINISAIYQKSYSRKLSASTLIGSQTKLELRALLFSGDLNHLSRASLTYNRLPNLAGASHMKISAWEKNADAYFQFEDLDGRDTVFVYDLSTGIRNVGLISQDTGQVIVKGFPEKRDLYIASDRSINTATISVAQFQNLSNVFQGEELVIITHRDLQQSAESYQSYRENNPINSLSTQIVYVDNIYDEFGYGTPSPLAIQRFCNYALDNWQLAPEYILLWGNAKNEIRDQTENLLPSYGNPVSDYIFVSKLEAPDRDSVIPQIPIGRVNIRNNQEGMNYLNKVIEYEQAADSSWIHKAVFLGGGASAGEQSAIRTSLENFRNIFGSGNALRSNNFCLIDSSADPNQLCYDEIDNGVGLIHFFGHSTANIQDIEIGEATDYQNYGRYPVMIAMGCNGADFSRDWSFGERWMVEPNRGAIAYLGTSASAYLNPLRDLGKFLYRELYAANHTRLGTAIITAIKTSMDSLRGIQYVNHALQFNLQGDPSLLWIPASGNNTSVDNELAALGLKLFPNPAKDQLSLNYELEEYADVQIRLLDMQGRALFLSQGKQAPGPHTITFDLRDKKLVEGIYFIQFQIEGKSLSQKLMIRN